MANCRKVLFLSHDASRTGAPLLLLHFLRWLRENSCIEFEILLKTRGELFDAFAEIAPTRAINRGLISNGTAPLIPRLRRKLGWAPSIRTQLQYLYPNNAFPLVYSNTLTNATLLRNLTMPGRRIICHAHEMRYVMEESVFNGEPPTSSGIDHFIAASEAVRSDLSDALKVPDEKITVVHEFGQPMTCPPDRLGVARREVRAKLGIGTGDVVVGMSGTPTWRKGIDVFLLLAKAVQRLKPTRRFVFIWLGVNPRTLEWQQASHDCRLLNIEDNVLLLPQVPNPQEFVSTFDLFALTSREDPFPLAMLEAAYLGIPTICFEGSGGASELVRDDAGVIVPYLDIHAMAEEVIQLGLDTNRRQRLGEIVRTRVFSNYTLESQAPKLHSILDRFFS